MAKKTKQARRRGWGSWPRRRRSKRLVDEKRKKRKQDIERYEQEHRIVTVRDQSEFRKVCSWSTQQLIISHHNESDHYFSRRAISFMDWTGKPRNLIKLSFSGVMIDPTLLSKLLSWTNNGKFPNLKSLKIESNYYPGRFGIDYDLFTEENCISSNLEELIIDPGIMAFHRSLTSMDRFVKKNKSIRILKVFKYAYCIPTQHINNIVYTLAERDWLECFERIKTKKKTSNVDVLCFAMEKLMSKSYGIFDSVKRPRTTRRHADARVLFDAMKDFVVPAICVMKGFVAPAIRVKHV
jgi:hypothetical protein